MVQKRARPRTEAEMSPLVAAWRRGEGTQAQVAARAGMPTSTFAWWCTRLAAPATPSPQFVPVDVRPDAHAVGMFELEVGRGRVLRVPSGFSEADLRRLLDVLEVGC